MLNLDMLGHYSTFIKLVNKEKNNSGDGLCQRFLMCAPHPLFGLKKKKRKKARNQRFQYSAFFMQSNKYLAKIKLFSNLIMMHKKSMRL